MARLHEFVAAGPVPASLEPSANRFSVGQHAAGPGQWHALIGFEPELASERVRHRLELFGGHLVNRDGLWISRGGGFGYDRCEGGDLVARKPPLAHHRGTNVDVVDEPEAAPEGFVQRTPRESPVAHPREGIEPLDRNPIGGAFVAEHLAPAADPRGLAPALAVTD